MKLTNKQIDFLNKNKNVVLGTADRNYEPRCIFVELNLVYFDKLIITDNEMKKTKKNILENPQVFILAFDKNYNCLKISGMAEYHIKTPYFDTICQLKENKGYKPKGAVVININKVSEVK